jgi:NDP-sugar pyrophosphorylase family protein
MQAVILAGGKGTRLQPYTNSIPKPLVPIGDYPILEVILRQLKFYGITEVILAVNHLSHLIIDFFGDGTKLGIKIRYSIEDKILGTAGPLNLIDYLEENFLVMNGDLLTNINYKNFYNFHLEQKSLITIGTFSKSLKIDLGVIKSNGNNFISYDEKPIFTFDVSMGLYVINRNVIKLIPKEIKFDMPDLVKITDKSDRNSVICYKGDYDWLDIGRVEDYESAILLFESDKNKYLP